MRIDATGMDFQTLNRKLRQADTEYQISGCCGQRFIAAGMDRKRITIDGIPGNALGAYLNGATIAVHGNAQDAVGDTMNAGAILIYGNTGDAAGYAMRGGKIYIKGNAGYRAGIHMKEYQEKVPVMIIGGTAGSFLGEYQAGGRILVLNLLESGRNIAGNFPCTGMHGGKVFFRGKAEGIAFPRHVCVREATPDDLEPVKKDLAEYCRLFHYDCAAVLHAPFTVVTPDSKNPYKQLYVAN